MGEFVAIKITVRTVRFGTYAGGRANRGKGDGSEGGYCG